MLPQPTHLNANPNTHKTHKHTQHTNTHAQTGTALARVKRDEHLQRTVRMVFSGQRFRRILDASLNAGGDDMTEFVKVRARVWSCCV
jgi:hypothetical protein